MEQPILEIKVTNPYMDKTYLALDKTMRDWKRFIQNYYAGNEQIFDFTHAGGVPGNEEMKEVTINPGNYASVEVREV